LVAPFSEKRTTEQNRRWKKWRIPKMNLFKKKPDAKEALRVSKREMSVATRGIEREIGSLQLEEKKLVAEIKKTAKTGNEVCFGPAKFVHLMLSQRTTTRSSTDCPHNRMKLILL
jgi:hypothetical protein